MGRGYHLWLNFESEDDLQLEGGSNPPLLDYKSAKAAASLGVSTYFPGSTRQPGIMDLKNYLHLQPFSNATGGTKSDFQKLTELRCSDLAHGDYLPVMVIH